MALPARAPQPGDQSPPSPPTENPLLVPVIPNLAAPDVDVFAAVTARTDPTHQLPTDQDTAEPGEFVLSWMIVDVDPDPHAARLVFGDGLIDILQVPLTPEVLTDLGEALQAVNQLQGGTPFAGATPDDVSLERIKTRFSPNRWIEYFADPANRSQRNIYIGAIAIFVLLALVNLFN